MLCNWKPDSQKFMVCLYTEAPTGEFLTFPKHVRKHKLCL